VHFRSVTIDLDGTLLDTIVDLADACNEMLIELGQPQRDLEQIHSFVGKGMAVLVERCLTYGVPPNEDLLNDAIDVFRRHYAKINGRSTCIYPGVIEGLNALCDQGLALACVTNKPAAFTVPLLERTGLAGYFAVVVSGDTLPHKKPRPEPILHACALMNSTAKTNLHIGDSANDIDAARAAGCPVLCVPYGYNEGRAVDSADCDALVSSLVEAAEWIARASTQTT
jgi:phosphoglycolate phosphatase